MEVWLQPCVLMHKTYTSMVKVGKHIVLVGRGVGRRSPPKESRRRCVPNERRTCNGRVHIYSS